MIGNQYQINKSFYEWCIENNLKYILDLWDYDKNQISPKDIGYGSNKQFYFKCPLSAHESEKHYIMTIIKSKSVKCRQCDSIGQFVINKYGEDYLKDHWSIKNNISPFQIAHGSSKKIWIRCTKKSYHPDYLQPASTFAKGCGCPYCSSKIILPQDSLGTLHPKSLSAWSEKNSKSAYEFSPQSAAKIWWKCDNNIHKDYQRTISNSVIYNFRCPTCSRNIYKKKPEDLSKQKFGKLQPLFIHEKKSLQTGKTYWLCRCDCGRYTIVHASHLKSGKIQSCGCLHREIVSGFDHWDWNAPTPSYQRKQIRLSEKYEEWRQAVLERDGYTCQCCGSKMNLQVHHKNNFLDYPEQRFEISNGITLCKKCHFGTEKTSFHSIYGTRRNTEQQLIEYLNTYGNIKEAN